jgi:hypothetical protein
MIKIYVDVCCYWVHKYNQCALYSTEIDTIKATISPKFINKDSYISFNNNKYYPNSEGSSRYFANRAKGLMIKNLSGKLYCSIGEKMYLLINLNESE